MKALKERVAVLAQRLADNFRGDASLRRRVERLEGEAAELRRLLDGKVNKL